MDQPAAVQPAAHQQPIQQQQPIQHQQQQPVMFSRHSTEREPGKEHIPRHPRGFVVLRALQLLFAIICLGLSAYVVSVLSFSSTALMIFVCIVTLVMSIYNIVALTKAHKLYNYWAVLAFDIFLFVFWLVAFAWVAATAAVLFVYGESYFGFDSFYYGSSYSYSATGNAYKALGAIAAAAAGIGALNWILYFISFVMTAVFIHRHRSSGLGNRPIRAGGAPGAAAAAVPTATGGEKVEMQPQQPGQIYPQPSGYSQAPSYATGGPQQGFYAPQQSMSPPPQQFQQQQQQYGVPPQQGYPVQQQYPQQYPDHSGQSFPQQQQQQMQAPYQGAAVSNPSGDGSHGVPAQTTGGSYVQGNPVAFPSSTHDNSQSPVHGQQQQQPSAPVHEAHGQSYDPHAARELQ
ncbi:membrane-associating domain-containing protein [Microdochium nivale]|nr:membrane-associating domain-containing protein [Microdochium nivale]